MSNWQSLAGYLQMKDQSGGLSLLWPKRRYYFVMDEGLKALLYFKSETEFNARRPPLGTINLVGATVTMPKDNRTFLHIRCSNRNQFEMEAETEISALVWLNKFQNMLGHKSSASGNGLQDCEAWSTAMNRGPASPGLPDQKQRHVAERIDYLSSTNGSDTEMAAMLDNALKSSLQSKSSLTTPTNTLSPLTSPDLAEDAAQAYGMNEHGFGSPPTSPDEKQTMQAWMAHLLQDGRKRNPSTTSNNTPTKKLSMDGPRSAPARPEAVQKLTKKNSPTEKPDAANWDRRRIFEALEKLTAEMDQQKRDYVSLLQSCVTIPLSENRTNLVDVRLYGGDRHKIRVSKLIAEARMNDPTLPTFENLSSGASHMDVYGFQHSFSTEGLILHYLCTQLSLHYQHSQQQANKDKWKLYLRTNQGIILSNKETRSLVRQGIPPGYRSMIWRRLIHQQVADLKAKFGKFYYKDLVSQHSSGHVEMQKGHRCHKQISLDLLRTMPNNIHFCSPNCKGVSQMQEVLTAFCQHNPEIGYCQGMNFIVATALLFLNSEDAFWLLVAMTEKYFVPSYFDSALSGAQADQEVLKELVDMKLPDLAKHLRLSEIELATITLNWYLAVFFDCLPFETMLRIWDVFLLEGPKVLFRFSLALLSMHKDALMERTDTISIMKILKAATKYTYDSDGLIQIAFSELKPFPKRKFLIRKQTAYLVLLKRRLKIKEEIKRELTKSAKTTTPRTQSIHLSLPMRQNHVLMVFGHQDAGKLADIDVCKSTLTGLNLEFSCRVLAAAVGHDVLYLSLLSCQLIAYNVKDCSKLWEMQQRDVCLALQLHDNTLFCGLANGSLAVIENVSTIVPTMSEVFFIPLGPAPISAICICNEQLWCAIASKAIVLNVKTMDTLEEVYLAANVSGGAVSFFERVQALRTCHLGVWVILQKSSLVQLWDTTTFTAILLYDVSNDHFNVTYKDEDSMQISCLLSYENTVWVGTTDGYLMIYEVRRKLGATYPSSLHSNSGSVVSNRRNSIYRRLSRQGSGSYERSSSRASMASASLSIPCNPAKNSSGFSNLRDSGYESVKTTSSTLTDNDGFGSPSRKQARTSTQSRDEMVLRLAMQSPDEGESFRAPLSVPPDQLVRINSPVPGSTPPPLTKSYSMCAATGGHHVAAMAAKASRAHERTRSMSGSSTGSRNNSSPQLLKTQSSFNLTKDPMEIVISSAEAPSATMKSYGSYNSVTTSNTGYEFDDFIGQYYDDSESRKQSMASAYTGGLASVQLSRTDSAWSLQSEPLSTSLLNLASRGSFNGIGKGDFDSSMEDSLQQEMQHVKLNRRDLNVDDFLRPGSQLSGHELDLDYDTDNESRLGHFAASDAASVISVGSNVEPPFLFELSLQMMLKISDKPVNNLNVCKRKDDKDCIISCSGDFGDEEAVLRWVQEPDQKLWTNDPVIEENELLRQMNKSPYNRVRLPRTV